VSSCGKEVWTDVQHFFDDVFVDSFSRVKITRFLAPFFRQLRNRFRARATAGTNVDKSHCPQ
jgi:hypothetical protein